jgi:hypothetical protein
VIRPTLIACALAAVAAGCGGGEPEPPRSATPTGFERYQGRGISFDRPTAWTRDTPAEGQVEFYGTPGEGGLPPQVMIGDAPARNHLRDVVKLHKGMQKVRFTTYDVTRDEPVEVPGAEAAHVVDAQYTMVSQGAKVLVRETNLLVQTNDGRQLDFFVRSPARDYDAAKLATIFDSFRAG